MSYGGNAGVNVAQSMEYFTLRDVGMLVRGIPEESVTSSAPSDETAWDTLMQLIENCTVNTGIGDLAHQHDHYLYGQPKKE
jgi:hypothetical protein